MAEEPARSRTNGWRWALAIALAIAVILIGNTVIVDRETRAAEPRDGGAIVESGIVPANVKVEGSGPPIVMLHGFSAAIDWWDDIAPRLAASHQLIRIDLIGHGGTAAPAEVSEYTIPRQAEMVAGVMATLGIPRVTLIAHSMGGEVASALVMSRPELVDRVILIDSPSKPSVSFNEATDAYLTPVLGEALSYLKTDSAIRKGLAQGFAPGFPVPEKFVADVRQLTYTSFKSATDASHRFQSEKPLYERLKAEKSLPPFFVIFGAEDSLVPVQTAKLFNEVPGVEIAFVDGAGHSPMVEQPERTLALIEKFLVALPPG